MLWIVTAEIYVDGELCIVMRLLVTLQAVDGRNTFMLYGSIIHYIFQQVSCLVVLPLP